MNFGKSIKELVRGLNVRSEGFVAKTTVAFFGVFLKVLKTN